MKILKISEGDILHKELAEYPGYFSELNAKTHIKQNPNGLAKSRNWYADYAREGRCTENIWVVLPDELYARYTFNEWGEVAP